VTYISLRDFLDVATKTGKPRVTKVRNIKHAERYSPATDFYKPLRQGIITAHKSGKPKGSLKGLLLGIGDKRKLSNYPLAIAGYDAWWGAHTLNWFDPPKGKYSKHGFEININPELGLEIDGTPHIIKLYLNIDPLLSHRAELIGALMTHVVGAFAPSTSLGALDVRRSMLVRANGRTATLMGMADSVLADMAAIWPTV
jgi:hypothetical protein